MANTKVTQHVIANNAITADQLASAAVTDAKLHATLDLSGKTLTLPATAIPSASTATTQAASDNSTKLATTAYVTTALANLVDSSPSSLNTLNELAAALNDDASFSTTVTNSIATKAPINNPTFTGSISHASDLTLDAAGDIILDADGADVILKDAGTEFGRFSRVTSDFVIKSATSDKDIVFKGNDGGSTITALTLDMSDAGFATFNDGGAFGGTGAIRIPQGTTGQRPTAATGQIRWNTTDGALEVYNGTAWTAVGTGSSNKVLDTFTGDNSTTDFTLSVTPANEDAIMVFIDGAYQEKGDYVLTNAVLALDTAPLSGEKIAVHITTAAVHDGTSAVNQQFTATANQTDFTLSQDPSSENNTQVYINGVYQQKTDYTVTGTTLAFDTGLTVGDVVEVNMFTVATLGNTDTVTEGVGNLYHTTARARGAISVSGNAIAYNSSTGVLTANFEEGPAFTGNVDVAGNITVGNNDSILAENNLRFKSAGAAYIDHNTTGQSIVFRTSNSSTLDTQALIIDHLGNSTIRSGGKLIINRTDNATGGEITYGPSSGTGFIFNDVNSDGIDFKTGSTMLMSIDSTNQKVGIGESTPLGTLHVKSSDSGASVDASADDLVIENNSNTGISILSGTSSTGSIYFGDSDRNWDGYIAYSHGTSPTMTIASNGGGNYIKLDDTGHVGLSTTPTAWSSGYKSLQIGARGFVGAHSGSDLYLGQNAYFNSGWKYEAAVAASLTQHSGGQITHFVAAAGSANAAISWTTALHIKPTGEVGIQTNAPDTPLHIAGDSASGGILIKQGAQVAYTPSSLANFRQGITFENTGSGHAYGIGYGQGGKIKFSYHDNASTYTELASIGGTSGDLSITSGSLILSSGEGISFSATSNASTAGTSMGSELLDDYEEGTWSPTIIAGTTNPNGSNLSPEGHYVKIGRQVWVSFYIGVTWSNAASGGVYVNRLPFTIANNGNNVSHIPITTYNFGFGTNGAPFIAPQLGQTNVRLYEMGAGGWGAANFASHVSSPLYITGQFTYFTS